MCNTLITLTLLASLVASAGIAQTIRVKRIEGMLVAQPRPPERLFLVLVKDEAQGSQTAPIEILVGPDGRFATVLESGTYLVRQHPPCSEVTQFAVSQDAGDVQLIFSPLPLLRDGAPGALTSLRITSFSVPLSQTSPMFSGLGSAISFASRYGLSSPTVLASFNSPLTMNFGKLYGTGFGGSFLGSSFGTTYSGGTWNWTSYGNSWNNPWPGTKTRGGVVLTRSLPCAVLD